MVRRAEVSPQFWRQRRTKTRGADAIFAERVSLSLMGHREVPWSLTLTSFDPVVNTPTTPRGALHLWRRTWQMSSRQAPFRPRIQTSYRIGLQLLKSARWPESARGLLCAGYMILA